MPKLINTKAWDKPFVFICSVLFSLFCYANPLFARLPLGSGPKEINEFNLTGIASPCSRALDFGNPCRMVNLKFLGIKILAPSNFHITDIGSHCVKMIDNSLSEPSGHIVLCRKLRGTSCSSVISRTAINCSCEQNPLAIVVWQQARGTICQGTDPAVKTPQYHFDEPTMNIIDALALFKKCTAPIGAEDPCPEILQQRVNTHVFPSYPRNTLIPPFRGLPPLIREE